MPLHIPEQDKARQILKDRSVRGKSLTGKQRGFFGAVASGKSKIKSLAMKARGIKNA